MISGSQHSGANEEDLGSVNDLPNKGDLNSSIDPDRDSDDEDRIIFQCIDCEKPYSDLEQ